MVDLLTPKEVANILKVDFKTLANQRYHNVGLPYVKLGKAVRYRKEDIESYLDEHLIQPGKVV